MHVEGYVKKGVPTIDSNPAFVTLFKKDDSLEAMNYRYISVTSCSSKILEQLLMSQIEELLHGNPILNDNQFGFRKTKSQHDAINLERLII